MAALKCDTCETRWPNIESRFATCPECEEPTTYHGNLFPINTTDANKRFHHATFEREYAKRGEREYDPSQDEHAERTRDVLERTERYHTCVMIPTQKDDASASN